MSPKEVVSNIRSLTSELIAVGLAIDQNFPRMKVDGTSADVGFSGDDNLAVTLKNVPYTESYAALREARAFNVLLIDGGLMQLLYSFSKGSLIKHRLAFFPSPDLIEYQNNSDIYELDEVYGDIIDKGVVTTPLRFDYDEKNFTEFDHPMSHMTIGQYKNCRIPVSGALTPGLFFGFVLRSFYNTPTKKYLGEIVVSKNSFRPTITDRERGVIHIGAHA